ncbi:MAG: hypothetical protein EAZ57_09510 [Cytophagales bacterium]|nr:MAG: hypothetical protein EAZ67_01460 [Cytophagales bacterium]TAF59875.1 MAG: hypothetical protein EAZ57_09510 [Cytophagales bacterium]
MNLIKTFIPLKKLICFCIAIAISCIAINAEAQKSKEKFDPAEPMFKDLPAEELPLWQQKDITAWREAFKTDASNWNPFQMEFYKQVKLSALNDEDKKKLIERTDEQWQAEFGGMDSWQVEQMLFYSAIQDLKME